MNDDQLIAAIKAFEVADDAARKDPYAVFGPDSNRKRGLFDSRTRRFKAWDRSGPCLYRGCQEQSIPRSHAVQRAQALDGIAEDQHVLTPALDREGALRLQRVGVRIASTFPGFCTRHELLFAEFEQAGAISTARHLALQMFRTLCREIARKRYSIEQGKQDLKNYRAARDAYYSSAIMTAAPGIAVGGTRAEGDEREDCAVDLLKSEEEVLRMLEEDLYPEFTDYLETGSPEPSATAVRVPLHIPVSLSGFAVVNYLERDVPHRALCLVGVVPQGDETVLFIGTAKRHEALLELWTPRLDHGFGILNAVESWMLHGSDHWFLKPSIWAALPPERQAKILEAITATEGNIGFSSAFSIFDDLRRWLIEEISRTVADMGEEERAASLRVLEAERAKLNR